MTFLTKLPCTLLPISNVLTDIGTHNYITEADVASILPAPFIQQLFESDISSYAVIGANITQQGSPGNVLLLGAPPLTEGINHWRFMSVPDTLGSFGCGMSNSELFGPGWRLGGLYVTSNGNLAGRGALKTGFVENMPQNPVIDWWMEVKGNEVDVYLSVNDVPQGHAFHLVFPNKETISSIRPVISFGDNSSSAKVLVMLYTPIPFGCEQDYKNPKKVEKVTDCQWKLTSDYPLNKPDGGILLSVKPKFVYVTVMNSFICSATFDSDGVIRGDREISTTRMLPPPALDDSEKIMTEMLKDMKEWCFDAVDNTLSIICEYRIFDFECAINEPLTINPFNL